MQRRQVFSLLGMSLGVTSVAIAIRQTRAITPPANTNVVNTNVSVRMSNLWQDLEAWLEQEIPELLAALNPGCSDQELAVLEQQLNCQLPEDFKAFYKIHNGQGRDAAGLFLGLPFLSLNDIYEQWSLWRDLLIEEFSAENTIQGQSYPEGAVLLQYIDPKWIPFTEDGSGNHLGIDLAPGPAGTVGQVINFGPDELDRYAIATSLENFVHWMLGQYQSGNFTLVFNPDYGRRVLNIREPAFEHFQDALPLLFRD